MMRIAVLVQSTVVPIMCATLITCQAGRLPSCVAFGLVCEFVVAIIAATTLCDICVGM